MAFWYFDKDELHRTASAQDGIPYELECRYRQEGARFIIDAGTKMDLGYNTMATGVVYFHRFYMYHSFNTFPRYLTACCCLFLAGKVEETPKKCKDIIKIAKALLPEVKYETLGLDPKEEVMVLERIILQTIKFDLQVDHPYQFLLKYAKCLKGDKAKLTKMVQMAWTFVNDSLCTTLCLQWEPEIIAVSLIYLACKLSKFELNDWQGRMPHHLRWWDMFVQGMNMDLLEDICHQVLDLYSSPVEKSLPSPPPQDKFIVPKKIIPPQSIYQKLLLQKMAVKYSLTSEQTMQAAMTKNVKLLASQTSNTPIKSIVPVPPGTKPQVNSVATTKTQSIQKQVLQPPPTPPKLLVQQTTQKHPPLPSTRPPLPERPPPPPSQPPLPPNPNQMIIVPQNVTSLPHPPMQPPPIPPGNFPPMYPYAPMPGNPQQPYLNPMFPPQPSNMMNTAPSPYRPHESMPPMGISYMGEAAPQRPPYNESYNQRQNITQPPPPPPPLQTYNEYEMTDGGFQEPFDDNRQKYIDGSYGGPNYGSVSQSYNDGQHYNENGTHYPDPSYQQYRPHLPANRGFNNRNNRPPPVYQNRPPIRNHPYQKR
ncbi:cyclin-K-like [Daktulosphaira vitifoliae]|uniref:cyclin-K-like n=1 Tax=Daktulosphaira vitifoliae TaxID=58002 RepID=UPI0021A9FE4D|nr:cyclin-K-like [Daktulosphaira vitifoliae]